MLKQDIRKHSFKKGESFFLDANVWFYLYGPMAGNTPSQTQTYSSVYGSAFKKLITAGSDLFLDALVLSEFINTYARLEYQQRFKRSYAGFKVFRQSNDFKLVAQDIAVNARKIVKSCQRCTSQFERTDIAIILGEYATGIADYNDQLIAEICIANQLTLITHDADFAKLQAANKLNILTANGNLL